MNQAKLYKELPKNFLTFKEILDKAEYRGPCLKLLLLIFRNVWQLNILKDSISNIFQQVHESKPVKDIEEANQTFDIIVKLQNGAVSLFDEFDLSDEVLLENLEIILMKLCGEILEVESDLPKIHSSLREEAEFILKNASDFIKFSYDISDPPDTETPEEDFRGDEFYFYFLALSLKETKIPFDDIEDYREFLYNVLFSSSIMNRIRKRAMQFRGMNVSRNSPCPCGSGKKYKYCHGRF
ncbi:SEC-C metal-binding domain-containing protein [Leptospira sp. id769339]|uniref:SEC-C metal-binding domain-containing protein n=1 Tax=Leptospira sp. id769339 TaxID=2864221 RepID=UPI00214D1124|nr:SEC-C metal-binding domain-containing protein [Leptospira sp. id769339]MCR1795364.1 SEC-C domain-containing protein [Leptospira sp. id769339]